MSNTIQIKGHLGRDAELKVLHSGAAVLNLSIPDTPRKRNDDGTWEDTGPTTWFSVSVWGQLAEALAESGGLVKGVEVEVTGTLRPRAYEKDGQQRVAFDVRADTVGFQPKRGAQQRPAPQSAPAADPWATDGGGFGGGATF